MLTTGGWARGNGMPEIGQSVVCAFPRTGLQEGFCLGSYWSVASPPPSGHDKQYGAWFPDGSYVYYDRTDGLLHIKAAGGVHIDGNLVVTGTITRGGVRL